MMLACTTDERFAFGFATVCKACAYRNAVGISTAYFAFIHKTFADSIEVVY